MNVDKIFLFFYFILYYYTSFLDLFNFNDSTYSKYYYRINEYIGRDKFV